MQKHIPVKIEEAVFEQLLCVPCPMKGQERQGIQIIDPEFSSVCPKTGLPDFGTIILKYIPDDRILELKSWKLYLRSFYGVGIFHEGVNRKIFVDLLNILEPKYLDLAINWGARGGLHTTTRMKWSFEGGYAEGEKIFEEKIFDENSRWINR